MDDDSVRISDAGPGKGLNARPAVAELMVFSKHLAGLSLEQAAKRSRSAGVDAWDLTVRPGGHVEPERVEDDLPRTVATLARRGIRVGMLTTAITDARDPLAERVLRAAAAAGVRHYKLGYWRYDAFGTLRALRAEVAARLADLADVNRALGLTAGFHNHSDDFFGANVADVDHVLDGIDPAAIGVYWDPAHATIEGGSRGWLMGLDLIAPRVVMLAVKDFRWVERRDAYAGGRRHRVEFCPLADGNTPWPLALAALAKIGFRGPISFHSEYQGSHSFADLTAEQVLDQTARDVTLFKQWLEAAVSDARGDA